MEFSREHHRRKLVATQVFALVLALVAARTGAAQPAGSLRQLPRPQACTEVGGNGIDCLDGIGLDAPADVAVSRDGKSVYVPSFHSNALAVFARDPATGALTQLAAPQGCHAYLGDGVACQDAIGLYGAAGVAVSPDNAHVYVASATSSSVTIFARDTTTGALTQLAAPDGCISEWGGGSTGCTDAYGPIAPTSVVVSQDGKHVFTLALNGSAMGVFARDHVTGKLTQLPAPEGCLAANGDGVTCKSAIALGGPRGLALSRNGKHLYVASDDDDAIAIFERDKTTGVVTQLPAPHGCVAEDGDGVTCSDGVGLDKPSSLIVARNGKHVYVASFGTDGVAILSRNASSGALAQLPAPSGCLQAFGDGVTCTAALALNGAAGVTQSNDGKHIYVATAHSSGVSAFRRNKKTGVLTQIGEPHGCSTATGDAITCMGGLGLSGARAIAVTRNGKHAYVASFSGDAVAAFAREK